MTSKDLIHELPKGVIKWYKFNKGCRALYVSCKIESDAALVEALGESELLVDTVDVEDALNVFGDSRKYDYVVMCGAFERCEYTVELLKTVKGILNENGKLLMAVDNRLAIRYFCGDRDPYTNRNFAGIDNYNGINLMAQGSYAGRAYAKSEIVDILEKSGFSNHRFYSVFPEIANAQLIFSEEYTPREQLDTRIFPQYNSPETVFLNEERLYSTLIHNEMFHPMANGFFVECPLTGEFDGALQVTISMERGRENALCTIIRNDGKVEKKSVYREGNDKVNRLFENNNYLKEHGVHMVDAALEDGSFVMPYVGAETATEYFRRIFFEDRGQFIAELDRFRDILIGSSEHVDYEDVDWDRFDPDWEHRKADDPNKDKWRKIAFGNDMERENLGIILKRGYIDLVSLNCFHVDNEFIFYDQELYLENLPVNAILQRTIGSIYRDNARMQQQLPQRKLLERYHLWEYRELWNQFTDYFLNNLRNDKILASYHREKRKDMENIKVNRYRINYSADEYENIFYDIFKGIRGRQIYLFGSGNYADKFVKKYGNDYKVAGIIDNDSSKWGGEKYGVKIYPPEYLRQLESGSYKIIICIKYYDAIIKQLEELEIKDYCVYDVEMTYARDLPVTVSSEGKDKNAPKKYHIGYIAGVFDLFHIGHLNLFRRAKEQCDYLIVGVVTDEGVIRNKKTAPYIPFKERIEIVRSCRYVDEAVEIPVEAPDTYDAYKRYKFDVQFSGSDYEDNPYWIAKKTFLQQHGSDMVFFPYTQSTSSTKLKGLIEKRLL